MSVQVHCAPYSSLRRELAGSMEGGVPILAVHLIWLVPSCCSLQYGVSLSPTEAWHEDHHRAAQLSQRDGCTLELITRNAVT